MEDAVQQVEMTKDRRDIGSFQRLLICVYFLISFFEPYLNGVLGSVTKYYILLLIGVIFINHHNLNIQPFHLCFIGWLFLKIVSVLWTTDTYIPRLHIFSQIGMVALFIVLTGIQLDKKTISYIENTMWFGSGAIGTLSLFFHHPYHGIVSERQVLYLFGQEADPNNQAAFLLIGLTIALYNLIIQGKYRLLSVATIAINALSLFSTGSRGGFVGLVSIVILLLIISMKGKKIGNKIKFVFLLMLVCIALYFIAYKFLPENIFERLFNFSSYEGGSDRDVIWENGWKLFTSDLHFLFGAGWGAYYGYNGFYDAMHNTFLSMLCDIGIVGFLIFFVPIFRIGFRLIKSKNTLPVLLLICGFVPSFFIEAINKRFFWNVIFLLFIVYVNCSCEKPKVKNEN